MTNIIATVSVLTILLLSLACGTQSATDSVPAATATVESIATVTTENVPTATVPAESIPAATGATAWSRPVAETPVERGPTDLPQSVSTENDLIAEYAQRTCVYDLADGITDDTTWGDYVERLEEVVDMQKDLTPPAELRDYHNAGMAAATSALELAESKPKGDVLNQYELWATPHVMVLAMTAGALADEFPDDIRAEFIKAGCSGFEKEPGDSAEPGTSWEDREINAEYTRHQDPLTDEVTLFFVIESTEDYGHLVIRASCAGEVQLFIGVQIWTSAGNEDVLLVRFDDDALQEETWIWENVSNAPEMVPESLLTPRQDRAVEFFANVMASEKLAVRYPEKDSIPEKTFIFDTTKLRDLWNQEGFKGCE